MRCFTVGFVLGLAVVLWATAKFALVFLLLVPVLVLVLVAILPTLKLARPWWLLMVGLGVGALFAQLSLHQQLSRQYKPIGPQSDHVIIGTIASTPKQDTRRASFIFQIDQFVDQIPQSATRLVSLNWYGGQRHSLRAGDQWQLSVRLKPPTSLGNPGGFNYARWLFQSRIHATGYVRDSPAPKRLQHQPHQLNAVRQSIADQIQTLPAANQFSALVQGLTVGVTSKITPEHWQTLRDSGTAHLLAISGLHIGLISGWFYLCAGAIWVLTSKISKGLSHRWITRPVFCVALSCVGALVYAALAGFSLPTQRALIMLGVFAATSVARLVWPPGTALMVALLLVLLVEPLSVLSVGFWLSFGTVSALFYLHNGRMHKRGSVVGMLGLHLKLGFVLLPVSAWFFQQGAMLAPLANAIAVPVVGFIIVPMSFIVALLASSWPVMANFLLTVTQWMLAHLLSFLDYLLSLPASTVPLFLPSPFLFLTVLLGLVLFFAPRGLRLRWLSVPLLVPVITLNLLGKPVKGLELHVLDVGQGLSAVLFTNNHTVIFDTGKSLSNQTSMVDRVVQPFLVSHGRASVDVSIVSHGDDDHAGGLATLLDSYPNMMLYSSDEKHRIDHDAMACVAGHSFVLDEVRFSFLHPGIADIGSDNNLSCVLLVHFGDTRILLTGDIESESEKLLVKRVGEAFPVTALVAPHHGSRSSSTPDFVALFTPENVIFAAGEGNAFGFPHADVVARYEQAGAAAFTTGSGGAVSMRFDQSGLLSPVDQYWSKRRRYKY